MSKGIGNIRMTIKESLNILDTKAIDNNEKFLDLRNLYEAANLDYEKKKKLKELIDRNEDPEVIAAYIINDDDKLKEALSDEAKANNEMIQRILNKKPSQLTAKEKKFLADNDLVRYDGTGGYHPNIRKNGDSWSSGIGKGDSFIINRNNLATNIDDVDQLNLLKKRDERFRARYEADKDPDILEPQNIPGLQGKSKLQVFNKNYEKDIKGSKRYAKNARDFMGSYIETGSRLKADLAKHSANISRVLKDQAKKSLEHRPKFESFGGAFDIEDDMFFTKDDLMEFGYDLVEQFSAWSEGKCELSDLYMTSPVDLVMEVSDEDGAEHQAKIKIDMRKIKLPKDIYKYSDIILKQWKDSYNEYHEYDESLNESSQGVEYLEDELADKSQYPSIEDAYQRNELTICKFKDRDVYYIQSCPNRIYKLVRREMKKYYPELTYLYDESLTEEKKSITEGKFKDSYNHCYVEIINGKPTFAYDNYSDAVRGLSYDKYDSPNKEYTIMKLDDGIYTKVDGWPEASVNESLNEDTVKQNNVWKIIDKNGTLYGKLIKLTSVDVEPLLEIGSEIPLKYLIYDALPKDAKKDSAIRNRLIKKFLERRHLNVGDYFTLPQIRPSYHGAGVDFGASIRKVNRLTEDTIKQNGKWVNKGKEGTHGKEELKEGVAGLYSDTEYKNKIEHDANYMLDQLSKLDLLKEGDEHTLDSSTIKIDIKWPKGQSPTSKLYVYTNDHLNSGGTICVRNMADYRYSQRLIDDLIKNIEKIKISPFLLSESRFKEELKESFSEESIVRQELLDDFDLELESFWIDDDVLVFTTSEGKKYVIHNPLDLDEAELAYAVYDAVESELDESLTEDTIKTKSGKWVNKGKEGAHGKFKTKKEADAQRKAIFANGYRESLDEDDLIEYYGDEISKKYNSGSQKKIDKWLDRRKVDSIGDLDLNGLRELAKYVGVKTKELDEAKIVEPKYRDGDVVFIGDASGYQGTFLIEGDFRNIPEELYSNIRQIKKYGNTDDNFYLVEYNINSKHLFEEDYKKFFDYVTPLLKTVGISIIDMN